jgi:exonuclease VII small subunit
MTSFNLEDAIQLRNRLERCRETYRHEWESVRQRWQDLQYTWRDSQYRNFEPDFQRLVHTHDDVLEDLERQLQSLERAISIANRLNETLNNCNNSLRKTPSSQQQSTQAVNPIESKQNPLEESTSETEPDIKGWENAWTELIKSANSFIHETAALAMMSISILGGISSSQPFIQANKLGVNFLKSGIEFVINDVQNFIDINNKTLGSDISSLPDEAIFKVIAKLSEDADKRHFGTEDIAELIGQYADNEEKKRQRRQDEQKVSL